MFIARKEMKFGDSDYAGIEPRMLAHLSKDKKMLELFNSGKDFHTYFAEKVGVDRDTAKVFDLETYYRATKYGIAKTLDCSLDQAEGYRQDAYKLFPELMNWQDRVLFNTRKYGYVTTLMGRRIKIDGINDTNFFINRETGEKVFWKRQAAERQTMNNICQGSASDVMRLGMIKVAKSGVHILIQVYDELVTEHRKDLLEVELRQVKEAMEGAIKLDVPLVAECKSGINWGSVE